MTAASLERVENLSAARRVAAVEPPTDLARAIDSYLLALEAAAKSRSTILTYASALRQLEWLARGLDCTRPEDLTPDLLRRALAYTMSEGRRKALQNPRRNKG